TDVARTPDHRRGARATTTAATSSGYAPEASLGRAVKLSAASITGPLQAATIARAWTYLSSPSVTTPSGPSRLRRWKGGAADRPLPIRWRDCASVSLSIAVADTIHASLSPALTPTTPFSPMTTRTAVVSPPSAWARAASVSLNNSDHARMS